MTNPLLKEEQRTNIQAVAAQSEPAGLGATLRSMREARRISVGEASQRLKFSVRQIQDLEEENWARLPTGVSLRGFVRNYARFLDVDVASVLVMLDTQVGSTGAPRVVIAPGVAGSAGDSEMPIATETTHRPWGWFFIILALLVIAGFYAIDRGWVPESWLIFDWLKAIAHNE